MTSVEPVSTPPGTPVDPDRFSWGDFFGFRFMITPVFIRIIYLIGVVIITIIAVFLVLATPVTVTSSDGGTTTVGGGILGALLLGVVYFLVAQLIWRIWMELLIVIFRIHGSLRAIEERGQGM